MSVDSRCHVATVLVDGVNQHLVALAPLRSSVFLCPVVHVQQLLTEKNLPCVLGVYDGVYPDTDEGA